MRYDGLIFDLDGTLWDATATYAEAWCESLRMVKSEKKIYPDMLIPVMGQEKDLALQNLLPDLPAKLRNDVYEMVVPNINKLIPVMGGRIYPGVADGIKRLSEKYPLFIVSNCPEGLAEQFLRWSGLMPFFKDYLTEGMSGMPKHKNMLSLIEKHSLVSPVYIGDTASDHVQSTKAKLPYFFVSYGFGETTDYSGRFDSFSDLELFFNGH